MYSLSGRVNTIAFNTLMTLGFLASINFLSCYPFAFLGKGDRQPLVIKPFKIHDYDTFVKDHYIGEDALSFTFDFEVDLRPLFNWNTNIVFAYISCEYSTPKSKNNRLTLWDQRVPRDRPENHIISLRNEYPEYYLTDVNYQLRDTDVKCYLNWEQMPIAGINYGDRILIGEFRTPKNYMKSSAKRKYAPGPETREYNY